MKLDDENKKWINDFVKKHRRKPRILHISNVANNAYNNAKLLTECGLDNHVIAYNDFYAMGSPEWEDAYFSEEIKDMWRPDWKTFNLHGFQRPRWFAQGEMNTCIDYLIELCNGNKVEVDRLFYALSEQNQSRYYEGINKEKKGLFEKIQKMLLSIVRKVWLIGYKLLLRIDSRLNTSTVSLLMRLRARLHTINHKIQHSEAELHQDEPYGKWKIDQVLINDFRNQFPHRDDHLSEKDLYNYYQARIGMQKLLRSYDIIMAYAVEGVYPLMFGMPYFAFEHGTIRDIPYEQDAQGRLCALVYRKANHVFVTNFDCMNSANFLAPGRYSVINHPYDEDQPLLLKNDWQAELDGLLNDLQSDFILFHPTRHDWVQGTGYADKANDVFLKAFISLRQQGLRLGLVCCEWGSNVDESKKILNDHGVSQHVRWIKPLGVIAYTRMCKMANLVVDQFKLGAFGGVTFKALAAGAPVMSYINVDKIAARYSEVPPIINCRTETDITEKLLYWYTRQDQLTAFGQQGRVWMKKFHNKSDTVNAQIKQFQLQCPV